MDTDDFLSFTSIRRRANATVRSLASRTITSNFKELDESQIWAILLGG